jgi:hypothetical protein
MADDLRPVLPSEAAKQAAYMTHEIQGHPPTTGQRLYEFLLRELKQAERRGAAGVKASDEALRERFEAEFTDAHVWRNDEVGYLAPYDFAWRAFRAGALGVKAIDGAQQHE